MNKNADNENEISREMTIENKLGFHARPATVFARVASKFESDIVVEKDGTRISAKSLMGLLSLEASCGTRIKVTANGPDAENALDELEHILHGITENQ